MASLTGNTIQSTYDSLLKVTDNDSITGSLKRITDGLGNNTPLYLSNSAVEIVSALNVTGVITGSNLSGTNTGDETKASIETKLGAASASNSGYLTSTDWSTFNNKVAGTGTLNKLAKFSSSSSIADSTITDTGSAVTIGVATSVTGSLTASSIIKSGGTAFEFLKADGTVDTNSYVTFARTLTINGTSYDLSADRSWTISTGLSGSGTTNYIPKFTGSTSLGNSLIFDNGTNVGIGTSSPVVRLNIIGDVAGNPTLGTSSGNFFLAGNNNLYGMYGGVNTTTGNAWLQVMRNDSATAYNLLLQPSGGNVGIGTGSPSNILHASRSATSDTAIIVSNAGTASSTTTMSFVLQESATPNGWFRRYRDGSGNTEIGFSDALLFSGNVTSTKAERMRITSGGNVGIGTTSPSSALHVVGSGIFSSGLTVGSLSSGSDAIISLATNASGAPRTIYYKASNATINITGTGGTDLMTITNGGNVGIGTSSPLHRLDIDGGASSDGYIVLRSSTGYASGLKIGADGSTINTQEFLIQQEPTTKLAAVFNRANGSMIFGTNNTERMRITSGGNVGIGTTSPGYKLQVSGTSTSTMKLSNISANRGIIFGVDSASEPSIQAVVDNSDVARQLSINPSGGNVGIGTTSPAARLHVVSVGTAGNTLPGNASAIFEQSGNNVISISGGSADEAGFWFARGSAAYYGGVFRANDALVFRNNDSERMRINSLGNVLINTTGDAFNNAKLQVNGGMTYLNLFNRRTASYTLSASDQSYIVEMNVGSANNLTVPPNSSVAFPIGTEIAVLQYGAGQTTIVAGSGVTLKSKSNALKISGQYAGCTLVKVGTDEWYVIGDLTL